MQRFRLLICNESFKPCHISRRISIRIQKSNLKAMREKGVLDRAESGQLPSPWGEKSVAGSGVPPPRPPWGEGSSPARPRCPSPTHHRPASARPNFLRCFLGSCFPPAKPTKRNPSWDGLGVPGPACLAERGEPPSPGWLGTQGSGPPVRRAPRRQRLPGTTQQSPSKVAATGDSWQRRR